MKFVRKARYEELLRAEHQLAKFVKHRIESNGKLVIRIVHVSDEQMHVQIVEKDNTMYTAVVKKDVPIGTIHQFVFE